MVSNLLNIRYGFFRDYGYPAKTALAYAKAELWAQEEDIQFEWEDDPEPWECICQDVKDCHGKVCRPFEVLNCYAADVDGKPLGASLCSIDMTGNVCEDARHRRDVEAELAYQLYSTDGVDDILANLSI